MTYRGNLGWLLSVIGVAANVGSWRRYTALLICMNTTIRNEILDLDGYDDQQAAGFGFVVLIWIYWFWYMNNHRDRARV